MAQILYNVRQSTTWIFLYDTFNRNKKTTINRSGDTFEGKSFGVLIYIRVIRLFYEI